MQIEPLLSLLADGQYHSGEEIGSALKVSRAAVWKQIQKLEAMGVECESVKGRGYRVSDGFELINKNYIEKNLQSAALPIRCGLDVLMEVDSTNQYLMRESQKRNVSGQICIAERQTHGKGRRGRQWVSPFAANLYLSLAWEFNEGISAVEGLSLALGVVLVEALTKAGINGLSLKWPNDLLYDNRKLGGILIEISGDPVGPCQTVIGIGLNVRMPNTASHLIDQDWTDLFNISGNKVSRNDIAVLLIQSLCKMLDDFPLVGFPNYRERWEKLDAHRNKSIILIQGEKIVEGVAQGVTDNGALKVLTESGLESFYGGEITVRL